MLALSAWGNEKEAALQSVSEEIRDDPKARLRFQISAKQELERVKTELSGCLGLLADGRIAKIKDAHTDMTIKVVGPRLQPKVLEKGCLTRKWVRNLGDRC